MFTNALLLSQDITALIRDIEVHERALFTVPQTTGERLRHNSTDSNHDESSNTVLGGIRPDLRASRKSQALAIVLRKDLVQNLKRGNGGDYIHSIEREKGDIDVEFLLNGAERLCSI